MRRILVVLPFLIAVAGAQTIIEVGAAAAGGSVGSAAGKKVSEGISSIFGKVEKTTANAARPAGNTSKSAPLPDGGVPKAAGSAGHESVPPPPPLAGHRASAKPVAVEPLPEIVPPPPPPPPPPQVTTGDLKKVANGTTREVLLKLGSPASRITMSDDGHLFETFSYAEKDTSIGRVKLMDGAVASVEVW